MKFRTLTVAALAFSAVSITAAATPIAAAAPRCDDQIQFAAEAGVAGGDVSEQRIAHVDRVEAALVEAALVEAARALPCIAPPPPPPTPPTPPTPPPAGPAYDRVVTLGDSYSSGIGIHRHEWSYDDQGPAMHSFSSATSLGASTCKRELQTATGPMLAAELGVASVMAACGGAETWNIPNQLAEAAIPGSGDGTLVSITIGGNDIRTTTGMTWPDLLRECIFQSNCHRKNTIGNFGTIQHDIAAMYTNLGSQFPNITVRVLAYPRIMQRSPGCSSVTGVNRSEADWMDSQVDVLNANISMGVTTARNATGMDIQFVSVTSQFDDQGACRFWQSDRYVNDKILGGTVTRTLSNGVLTTSTVHLPWTVSSSSFHPSQQGYNAYLAAIRTTV